MKRRHAIAGSLVLPFVGAAPARAQEPWPQRSITMIVPFPAGGQADLAARPVSAALERILGKPVVVDNRGGGGGGAVGNAAAARAAPDGYTLVTTLSSLAVLPEADRLFGREPAYEVSQFTPIARNALAATDVMVTASGLLRAADLAAFELGMWQGWTGR